MKTCAHCRLTKSLLEFYFDNRRKHHRPRCKECVKLYQQARNKTGKNRTPLQRAEYRRKRGEVTCEYIPRSVRAVLAKRKREYSTNGFNAHVESFRRHNRIERAKRKAMIFKSSLHDAHVRVYRSKRMSFRRHYTSNKKYECDRTRNYKRKAVTLITDQYIRRLLCEGTSYPRAAVTIEFIDAKREHLRVKRLLREMSK